MLRGSRRPTTGIHEQQLDVRAVYSRGLPRATVNRRLFQHYVSAAVGICCLALLVQYQQPKSLWDFIQVLPARLDSHVAPERPSDAFCSKARMPYVCAHGGDTTNYPPNTAAAYQAALAGGVDCIELDVSLTADNQLIALHSRDLQRLIYKPNVQVQDYTLQQLLDVRWPSGDSLLTTAAALAAVAASVDLVILDVKVSSPARVVTDSTGTTASEETLLTDLLLQLTSDGGYNNTLIWSKSDTVAELVKHVAPWQLTGYTVMFDHDGTSPHFEDASRANMQHSQVAAVYHGMLNHTLAEKLTAANKSVFVWSVDEPQEMERMLNLSVHGVVTNKPGVLLDAIKKRQQACDTSGPS